MASAFHFFDLPPELRNIIYCELFRPVTRLRVPGQSPRELVWKASVKSYLIPGLLGISKQFKEEYEREVCQHAKLCLRYDPWEALGTHLTGLRPIVLPGCLLENIRHVEFDVVLRDWSQSVKPMLEEKYGLLRLCNFPTLRTLDMHFSILSDMPEHWLEEETEPSDDMNELEELVQNFSAVCAQMFRRVQVDICVYVKTTCFEPYTKHIYGFITDQLNLVDVIHHELEETRIHEAVWKASVAQPGDQYVFEGMHLEFLRGGHFDAEEYDDLRDDAIRMLEHESYELGQLTSLIDEGASSLSRMNKRLMAKDHVTGFSSS